MPIGRVVQQNYCEVFGDRLDIISGGNKSLKGISVLVEIAEQQLTSMHITLNPFLNTPS